MHVLKSVLIDKRLQFAGRFSGALILALLLAGPLWLVRFPPLLDYPNHLARSFILIHLHDHAFNFSRYFHSDFGLYPYLGMDALMAVLGRLFPIESAGRILLSICTLAVPAAAVFFIRIANPGSRGAALWSLLIAYNIFFLEGFLNFDLGIALGLAALGLWLRWIEWPTIARWIAVLIAFATLYFAHLLGFVIAGLIVISYLAIARRPLRDWLWSGAMALPGLLFYFCSSRIGFEKNPEIVLNGLSAKFRILHTALLSYSPELDQISLAAIGIWFLAAWWHNPEFRWNRRWLGVAAVLFGLFLACPWMYGNASDLDIRFLPFFYIILFASAHVGKRAKWLAAIPILLFVAKTSNIAEYYIGVQPQLAGLARSFEIVPRNALVFPIVEGDQYPTERPFTHFWAYGTIQRGWFSPYLFDIPGQTPLRIAGNHYKSDGLGNLVYSQPPDWTQVQREYEYVWAYDTPRFSSALMNIGDRIYSYGPLEVYRLRR